MRNTALGFAFVVLVALGAGTGWYWWTAWRFQQSTDDAYVQSDITVISPKIEGYIKDVRVEENQQVAAGQVLIVVDDRDFAAKAAQAEAAVATAEAIVATYASRLAPDTARLQALHGAGHQRFCEPAALRDRRRRFAQGRGGARQGARGAGRRAEPARRARVAKA